MNIRNLLLSGASAFAVTTIATSALAQATATTSATASITIFQPITIVKNSDLQFGRVIRPSAGSTTYTVSAADGTTVLGGGDGIFSGSVVPTRAVFTVGGEGGQLFNITSDATVVNGGITINLVKSSASLTLGGTLGTAGTATFGVGGNVTLTSASTTGVKSGSFNVTVTYQ